MLPAGRAASHAVRDARIGGAPGVAAASQLHRARVRVRAGPDVPHVLCRLHGRGRVGSLRRDLSGRGLCQPCTARRPALHREPLSRPPAACSSGGAGARRSSKYFSCSSSPPWAPRRRPPSRPTSARPSTPCHSSSPSLTASPSSTTPPRRRAPARCHAGVPRRRRDAFGRVRHVRLRLIQPTPGLHAGRDASGLPRRPLLRGRALRLPAAPARPGLPRPLHQVPQAVVSLHKVSWVAACPPGPAVPPRQALTVCTAPGAPRPVLPDRGGPDLCARRRQRRREVDRHPGRLRTRPNSLTPPSSTLSASIHAEVFRFLLRPSTTE